MIRFAFVWFCFGAGLAPSSSLRVLNRRVDCRRPGLDHCTVSNCSDRRVVVDRAPSGPLWARERECVGLGTDRRGLVPVMNLTWKLKSDAGILALRGSEITIVDERSNESICVQFSYSFREQLSPDGEMWTFSLDGVVVEPGRTYAVSAANLPQPPAGREIAKRVAVPGCDGGRIQKARTCLENGSLWEPCVTTDPTVDRKRDRLLVVVDFKASRYSERYRVSIQSQSFLYSKNVTQGNATSLNVTFELSLAHCDMVLTIQPFFRRCKNDCWRPERKINHCPDRPARTLIVKSVVGLLLFSLLCFLWRASHKGSADTSSSAAKDPPGGFLVQRRKRVLIIYSLDHPLYTNIVLKLCGFLATKCGTEVVLDLLDSTRLGVLGGVQWLDWQRAQIESSSDKILILCSPGVQAKWRAMCGDRRVVLREDVLAPAGDMLTPALSLMVPQFIRSASFAKYIVAYFDDVCSDEDVPAPLRVAVRYKLMRQFEELFFRILDAERHEPGRTNRVAGLSEDEYHRCPPGGALRDAVDAFRAHQLEHPRWFEEQRLEDAAPEAAHRASPGSAAV